ncbi:hypothetical protein [endosymbiont GvMRE of Glomus versiforme]|uniref:hypothetical protein n=1 Tax=endosymbiont GvMRE of Glomus versiforme TaxID=2039283 RepID=UPI0011C397AC|nr:hypothetical protein [endosymbiont GvMRE of Glomus versiforme]
MDWEDIHRDFSKYNQKDWKNLNFTYQAAKKWTEVSFNPRDYEEAKTWINQVFNPQQTKEWIEAGLNIQEYKNWIKLNFTEEEIKSWINSGAKLDDAKFINWLKNIKKETLEWIAI